MAKRIHTTVTGVRSRSATLVAINDAPQTTTANVASRYGKNLELDMNFPLAMRCQIIVCPRKMYTTQIGTCIAELLIEGAFYEIIDAPLCCNPPAQHDS